jgi:hypothetical protein
MGFLGEIFHPQHDEVEKPAEAASSAQPETAATATVQPGTSSEQAPETGAAAEVKPGGSVDSVTASSDSSTVDLGSVQVSPVAGENSSPDAPSQSESVVVSAESAASSDNTVEKAETDTAEPTSVTETGGINISVDPANSVESSDEVVKPDEEADSSETTDDKSAEEMLAEWQKESPTANTTDVETTTDAVKSTTTESSGSGPEVSAELPSVVQSDIDQPIASLPESSRDDDSAAKLTKEAADEAGEIDEAMAVSQAPSLEVDHSKEQSEAGDPEIGSATSEVNSEKQSSAESDREGAVGGQDAPFPELRPDDPELVERTKSITGDNAETTSGVEVDDSDESKPESEPTSVIGGDSVHLDRAEYLTDGTAEAAAKADEAMLKTAEPGDPSSAESQKGAEVVDIAEFRAGIDKIQGDLDKLRESLDKAV